MLSMYKETEPAADISKSSQVARVTCEVPTTDHKLRHWLSCQAYLSQAEPSQGQGSARQCESCEHGDQRLRPGLPPSA